jgi:hypothetical protein
MESLSTKYRMLCPQRRVIFPGASIVPTTNLPGLLPNNKKLLDEKGNPLASELRVKLMG